MNRQLYRRADKLIGRLKIQALRISFSGCSAEFA